MLPDLTVMGKVVGGGLPGRRLRRLGRADGADRPGRRRLPGRHAVGQPAGRGRRHRGARAARRRGLPAPQRHHRRRWPTGLREAAAHAGRRAGHAHLRPADRLLLRDPGARLRRRRRRATSRPTPPGAGRCSPAASTRRRRSSRPGSRRSPTRTSTSRARSRRPRRRSRSWHERARRARRPSCAPRAACSLPPSSIRTRRRTPPSPSSRAPSGALAAEAIHEGALLHYAARRACCAATRRTSSCSPATGCTRSASTAWPRAGDLEAIALLADVIARCARAAAEGRPGRHRGRVAARSRDGDRARLPAASRRSRVPAPDDPAC